jgi:glycosyltransferase involved in cell wall biosynthesis
MSPRISIAMATYNGEKYLQEQLDSLAAQTYPPCELVVGDDGSSDGTVAILEEFSRRAPFPVHINRNPKTLGFGDNFLQTASACSGDWISFCDQDDVWLPKKLEKCAQAICRSPSLNMVLQNAELCDEQLNARGRLFPNSLEPGIYGAGQQYGLWVWAGFLQTVNSAFIRDLQFEGQTSEYSWQRPVRSHDKWTCIIANALGGICVLGEAVVLYRRHENAISGNHSRCDILKTIDDAFRTGARHYALLSTQAANSAIALRRLGETVKHEGWANCFGESALQFDLLSETQAYRVRLYESDGFVSGLRCFAALWWIGGYFGPRFIAMGWRSALKDAAVAITGGKRAMATER